MIDSADYSALSFVGRGPDHEVDFWAPQPTASYSEACALGRSYGEQLHTFMRDTGNPALLGAVVRAITTKGAYAGAETGFCSYFGVSLLGQQLSSAPPSEA